MAPSDLGPQSYMAAEEFVEAILKQCDKKVLDQHMADLVGPYSARDTMITQALVNKVTVAAFLIVCVIGQSNAKKLKFTL